MSDVNLEMLAGLQALYWEAHLLEVETLGGCFNGYAHGEIYVEERKRLTR
jgi:hypothetical protein